VGSFAKSFHLRFIVVANNKRNNRCLGNNIYNNTSAASLSEDSKGSTQSEPYLFIDSSSIIEIDSSIIERRERNKNLKLSSYYNTRVTRRFTNCKCNLTVTS
jgi:hypothetical protein